MSHTATNHSTGQSMSWELQIGPVCMKLPEARHVKFVCLHVSWALQAAGAVGHLQVEQAANIDPPSG